MRAAAWRQVLVARSIGATSIAGVCQAVRLRPRAVFYVTALAGVTALALTGCSGQRSGPTVSSRPRGHAHLVPTLGRAWGPFQKGYGQPHPTYIFNGGDPSGLVTGVYWRSWGSRRAVGTGRALHVTTTVADARQKMARVVAFNLGMCGTTLAYRALEWYFPQFGQAFSRRDYINVCTGQYVSNGKAFPQVPRYAGSTDPPAIIRVETDLAPSVVSINATKSGSYSSNSTGMIFSSSGLVLAESSSIYGATSFTARVMSSGQLYKATVVGSDSRQDVTVLRLRGASGLQPIHAESSRNVAR